MYACDRQYLDWSDGRGDWYLVDEFLSSGVSTDRATWFPARLTSLRTAVRYPSDRAGNEVLDWDPNDSENIEKSCEAQTTTVTDTKSGVSYTQAGKVCPDKFGPWVLDTYRFGTRWDGKEKDADVWESTLGTAYTHNPPCCSPAVRHYGEVHWEG